MAHPSVAVAPRKSEQDPPNQESVPDECLFRLSVALAHRVLTRPPQHANPFISLQLGIGILFD